jgi:hypothetical protein
LRVPRQPLLQLTAAGAPTGAAFDVVLMAHVAFALIGLGSLFLTGLQAWRARTGPGSSAAESVARYFRPGVNWPGRSLYAVVVLGVLLVFMSQKAYGFDDPFVQIGFVLWIGSVAVAELSVWPGERRLQTLVSGSSNWIGARAGAGSGSVSGSGSGDSAPELRSLALRVSLSAWLVCVALVVAVVVMVQKP